MKKQEQGLFEKIIYYIVGAIFFLGYYLLMTEVFTLNPFKGFPILLSVYFLIAVITFPKSGDILSRKVENYIVDSKVIMPLAYILGPILALIKNR